MREKPLKANVWQEQIGTFVSSGALKYFDRAIVLESCGSTQDEALARCAGRDGLVLTTIAQESGRGRLGRSWHHDPAMGLAITFVLGEVRPDAEVSLAAGLAAAEVCDTPESGMIRGPEVVGVKWPNDIVRRQREGAYWPKIAGVLIERRAGLLLVGIGINVNHGESDWPPELAGRAISLRQLWNASGFIDRVAFAQRLIASFDAVLAEPDTMLARRWADRDVLIGTVQEFDHNNTRHRGVVERIDPTAEIVLRTASGFEHLPALTTSLVTDQPQPAAVGT